MKRNLLIIFSALLLASCGTTTKLTVFWADKEYEKGKIDKLLVVGLTERESIRRTYEADLVTRLEKLGIDAISSADVLPIEAELDTTAFRLHFKNEGFDVVLTTQMVGADKNQRYEPGYTYSPSPYAYGFGGYYGHAYTTPGYVVTTTTYKIETNLYDAKTEKLIWSGISETFEPSNELDAIQSINKSLMINLERQGYFLKK